jgi:hypothetical protein
LFYVILYRYLLFFFFLFAASKVPKTPDSFAHHYFIDTPGGSLYSVPKVSLSVLPVLGTEFDSLDACEIMYRKYASEAGFGVRISSQKRLRCGYVKQKYFVCNREGCPKELYLNTLVSKKGNKRFRTSNIRVTGCKARVVFDMIPGTTKFMLKKFDPIHNHELDRVEYKHLSKSEKQLTYAEQMFIVKAGNVNLGLVKAHNLYTGLKGSASLVHGTEVEFKNYVRGINCFIGDADAQMLINHMENRQKYIVDFSNLFFALCSFRPTDFFLIFVITGGSSVFMFVLSPKILYIS